MIPAVAADLVVDRAADPVVALVAALVADRAVDPVVDRAVAA